MQANKSSGTQPELLLAKTLFARGHRYRKNNKTIFGKPDLTFKKIKLAIFVDGEFWHGRNWEERKFDHKSNQEFWINKIERNIERDKEVNQTLKSQGWRVLRFWDKEIEKNLIFCILQIEKAIKELEMKFKGKNYLEVIEEKKFKIKLIEPENNKEAVLTHYLHNSKDDNNSFFCKDDAVSFAKEILEYNYPEKDITRGIAEEALQYGIFNAFEIPFPPIEKNQFKFIDLFVGIGGIRLALQNLGERCVFASEWDKEAMRIYKAKRL